MSKVEVWIRVDDLITMSKKRTTDKVKQRMHNVLKKWVGRVQRYARRYHTFTSRTGNLVSAILEKTYNLSGKVYISDMQAPYGVFLHNGTRYIKADPFVQRAYDDLMGNMSLDMMDVYEDMMSR